MIEYIIPHNPDDRILKKADELLQAGEIICFPTDTNWILAASSENKVGIEKLYKIKHESKQKHFSLLCSHISMASEVAIIDNQAFKFLKMITPGHYTFIFEATKKIAKHVQASKTDKEVGIRIVPLDFVSSIIDAHGHSLVSTNIPMNLLNLPEDSEEPIYSFMLEENISHLVAMIIDPGEHEFAGPSTIFNFTSDEAPVLVREGAGSVEGLY
ncbi:MAG: threonylcarbamoyl-AMP synthase [Halobacteriovoraceae bacterium]|nr:threonylcarbamoyl-AMP synthase [Halobacteriovoraceae bacterium]|tara:strand:+ start:5812 stop:6450 length:639 start_codon:yes stop_codon:yes gene_type:complete